MSANINRPPIDRCPLPEARARLRPGYAGDPLVDDPFIRYPAEGLVGYQEAILPFVVT